MCALRVPGFLCSFAAGKPIMFKETLFHIGDRDFTVGHILWAVITVVIAVLLLRLIKAAIHSRAKGDHEQRSRLHSAYLLVKYAVWVATIIIVLQVLGMDITFLVAGSAALLVGLGIGIQQTFNDIISGVFILMEGTIMVGDVLEVEGLVGRVTEINLRTSTIYSRDGMNVIVPNHRFINENVVNWSHNALETRFNLKVGVAYGSDAELVKRILMNCAVDQPDVVTNDPAHAVQVRFIDFGDSALIFELLFWSRNIFAVEQTKSDIRFRILGRFREAGIGIPFPQRDVHIIAPKV
ncbi:MAG: mechanosensitive ion channel domain-containing protein [Flavobacteriales bacterium]|nr:mechanosensitive ion channel [Flavobacteriales bacterium]